MTGRIPAQEVEWCLAQSPRKVLEDLGRSFEPGRKSQQPRQHFGWSADATLREWPTSLTESIDPGWPRSYQSQHLCPNPHPVTGFQGMWYEGIECTVFISPATTAPSYLCPPGGTKVPYRIFFDQRTSNKVKLTGSSSGELLKLGSHGPGFEWRVDKFILFIR